MRAGLYVGQAAETPESGKSSGYSLAGTVVVAIVTMTVTLNPHKGKERTGDSRREGEELSDGAGAMNTERPPDQQTPRERMLHSSLCYCCCCCYSYYFLLVTPCLIILWLLVLLIVFSYISTPVFFSNGRSRTQ